MSSGSDGSALKKFGDDVRTGSVGGPPADDAPADDAPADDAPADDAPADDGPPADAPPGTPTWTLEMRAGPVPAFLQTLKIDIPEITWKITADYGKFRKTVKVTPAPGTAVGSVKLPVPTGAVKTVTVTISGKWSTQGGSVDGVIFPPQSNVMGTDTEKVAFIGSNEVIAWVITPKVLAPGVFAVLPLFQEIKP